MKRYFTLIILFVIMFSISGCSSKANLSEANLELTNFNVAIVKDKSVNGTIIITNEDENEQEFISTALVYEFTIKNKGNKKIGRKSKIEKDKLAFSSQDNQIRIEPNEDLEDKTLEIIGIDIFDPSSYMNTGLGFSSPPLILKPGEEKKFILTYDLGVDEENPFNLPIIPSEEKLTELESYALDGILVIIVENEKIAHFNLNKQ